MDPTETLKTKYKLIAEIFTIARKSYNRGVLKPHKLLMLLSVLDLMDAGQITENRIPYDTKLILAYERNLVKYKISNETLKDWYPFYHSRTSFYWKHEIFEGRQSEYLDFKSTDGPSKMQRIINFAFFDEEVFNLIIIKNYREDIHQTLIKILIENKTQ